MRRLFILTTLFLLTIQTFAQDYKYVNTETLNIRRNPGKQFSVVGKVNRDERIMVLSESGSWTEIETESGKKGYVATKYLSSTNDTQTNNNKKVPWVNLLIVLGILVYVGYKIKNFFSGLFSSSAKSKKTSSASPIQKTFFRPIEQKLKHICKCCGYENEHLQTLTAFSCSKSQTRKHQPLEGGIQPKYICKDCGYENKSLQTLTAFSCNGSPTGNHRPFEGGFQPKYYCKYCGYENKSLQTLTVFSCSKSPTGKHQPLF